MSLVIKYPEIPDGTLFISNDQNLYVSSSDGQVWDTLPRAGGLLGRLKGIGRGVLVTWGSGPPTTFRVSYDGGFTWVNRVQAAVTGLKNMCSVNKGETCIVSDSWYPASVMTDDFLNATVLGSNVVHACAQFDDSSLIVCGMINGGQCRISTNGGFTWADSGHEPMDASLDMQAWPSDDGYVYFSGSQIAIGKLVRTNNGNNFQTITIPGIGVGDYVAALLAVDGTLYIALSNGRIYIGPYAGPVVLHASVIPGIPESFIKSGPNIVLSSSSHVWYSSDQGVTWNNSVNPWLLASNQVYLSNRL